MQIELTEEELLTIWDAAAYKLQDAKTPFMRADLRNLCTKMEILTRGCKLRAARAESERREG